MKLKTKCFIYLFKKMNITHRTHLVIEHNISVSAYYLYKLFIKINKKQVSYGFTHSEHNYIYIFFYEYS